MAQLSDLREKPGISHGDVSSDCSASVGILDEGKG